MAWVWTGRAICLSLSRENRSAGGAVSLQKSRKKQRLACQAANARFRVKAHILMVVQQDCHEGRDGPVFWRIKTRKEQ
jgi:hypothetical protein